MTKLALAPETARLAAEVKEWAVLEVRPFAREADRIHDIPEAALKAVKTCPIPHTPIGGQLDYPRRNEPDFDSAGTDGKHMLGSALVESLYYGDMLASLLVNSGESLADRVVTTTGTPAQVEKWIEPIRRGEYNMMAFAMTEPSAGGSDPASMQARASRVNGGWLLNGHKHFCSNGARADLILVFATIDPALGGRGIRAFVVPRGTPGVCMVKRNESKLGLRSMVTTEFVFENVQLPADAMVGEDSDDAVEGLKAGLSALNSTRGYLAAMAVGTAQACVDEARSHLGRTRAALAPQRLRVVEDELDRMDAALDRGRYLVRRFAALVDAGQPYRRAASVAKAYACPLAERIIQRVIQHLGTVGCSEESLVEKWHRDVKILDIFEGTANIQRIVVGRDLRRR
jgi:acyl-CoA dehydrogenase